MPGLIPALLTSNAGASICGASSGDGPPIAPVVDAAGPPAAPISAAGPPMKRPRTELRGKRTGDVRSDLSKAQLEGVGAIAVAYKAAWLVAF
jgi:hypothetical protein